MSGQGGTRPTKFILRAIGDGQTSNDDVQGDEDAHNDFQRRLLRRRRKRVRFEDDTPSSGMVHCELTIATEAIDAEFSNAWDEPRAFGVEISTTFDEFDSHVHNELSTLLLDDLGLLRTRKATKVFLYTTLSSTYRTVVKKTIAA